MEDFLSQLPTLIGVVVGVLGTLLTTSVTERTKWRRDQSVRWDNRRLDAFIAYAATIKEVHAISARMTSPRRNGNAPAIDHATGLEQLSEATLRRSREWESLLLLADEATVNAGRQWWNRMRAEEVMARSTGDFDVEAWERAVREADVARDAFYKAARATLAVGGGSAAKHKDLS